MKKILALSLSLLLCVLCVSTAFASGAPAKQLSFNEDGKFTVVNICDIQDGYPMNATTKQFIKEMLVKIDPDIVVLGGDNTVCSAADKADAIKEICEIFVENETYFTLVFGNHDHQQGVDKETLLAYYQQFGGEYCLAYDAEPALFGVGTHNLTVKSSDGSKDAFNLYMFDSNTYYPEEGDNELGYDAVHTDEIEWYKNTSAALKEANGGTVPAMAFQHIIVQEIYEKLFIESPFSIGKGTQEFEDTDGTKHYYTYLPKVANIEEGYLYEQPCPGYKNYGQLDAFAETGDVIAVFSGHDHTNSFRTVINGIDVVNTAGCTYHSYGKDINRGCRVIVLDENDLSTYESYTWTMCEQALEEGSVLTDLGEITKAGAVFSVAFQKFMKVFMEIIKVLFFIFK